MREVNVTYKQKEGEEIIQGGSKFEEMKFKKFHNHDN